MNHQTHFFFAVDIPEETKQIMKEHCEQLKRKIPFSHWVYYEDLHITLAFLGGAPSDKLKRAEKNVAEAVRDSNSLKLAINKLGIFRRNDSPRIFWADTIECNELQALGKQVYTACKDAGFDLESRPFRPHITIARKWQGEEPFQSEILDIWKELQPEPLKFNASTVVLYQTHLHKMPKYEAITRIHLH